MTSFPSGSSAQPILNTRRFPFPREQVYGAFSDPALLARWWGPAGFTNTITRFDFRPNGAWHLVMRAPDGTEYPNESEFIEVNPPEFIVFRHHGPMHSYALTITFAPDAGQTVLTWHMVFDDPTEAERLREFITGANEQNLDRLSAVLKQATGSS
ncbi:SRPBCC family protein [Opitutaceae bacterium]